MARTVYATKPQMLLPLPCREDLPALWSARGLLGAGVEVGVLRGEFSRVILDGWGGRALYLVDPWMPQAEAAYRDINNANTEVQEAALRATLANVAPHASRVHIVRALSVEAAAVFADAFFDWVYLDAAHHFEAVTADLAAWWPKLRLGGMLTGHDFVFDGVYPLAGEFGVMRAVLEFAAAHERQVMVTFAESAGRQHANTSHCATRVPSWYLIK